MYSYIIILQIISLITSQIVTTYGHYIIKYFKSSDSFCLEEPIESYSFPVDSLECIKINSTHEIQFKDWDSYSNSLRYFGISDKNCPEEISEDDEGEYNFPLGSFVCNGQCLKNIFNDSYYLCYYNNIINSATVTISQFKGKKCKSYNLDFQDSNSGKKLCWMDYDNYSFLPLFWIDADKRLYYQEFNHSTCYGGFINLKDTYFICNGKCHTKLNSNQEYSYKCKFDNLGRILSFSLLKFWIFILIL